MRGIIAILLAACLSACSAANQAAFQTDVTDVLAVTQQINQATTTIVMDDGPIAVSILCAADPVACPAAQGALKLAQATQLELNNLTVTAQAVNAAPPAAKVSTAVTSILTNFGQINALIAQYGGKPVNVAPVQAALAALPPPTVSTP
jgi:hypothetical protein